MREGFHLQRGFDVGREVLKWIAIATMTIDHIGAILYPEYVVMRIVGRLALPIFCYLLTLGVNSTRNVRDYFARLFLFALISQVPFCLAFGFKPFEAPNILFTLSLGVIILQDPLMFLIPVLAVSIISYVFLGFDLGLYEFVTIFCMYTMNRDRKYGIALLLILNVLYALVAAEIQIFALCSLPIILLYKNGYLKMGKENRNSVYPTWRKYFFYIYYPLHLAVLHVTRVHFFY